jgi:hypothetical protein
MPGTTESELHSDSNADFFNGIRQQETSLPNCIPCNGYPPTADIAIIGHSELPHAPSL